MASAKLRRRTVTDDKFLAVEKTRTIKPADFKSHLKFSEFSQADFIELLCLMEAELQAKDILLKAILSGEVGTALPLSNLLNDFECQIVSNEKHATEEDEEVWLGEPSAHLTHVVAYHQVVTEQMQTIVNSLQKQHQQVLKHLSEEKHRHAVDRAQGDDVTYMLEKEREKLQHQIEVEQLKYIKLENENNTIIKILENERQEHCNTFNNLVNDCKAFAQQLMQQSLKYEQCLKEIEKEKLKNKLLSELMVKEAQRFKEKLKSYEDQVNDLHVLEQKRLDLEMKLVVSEKSSKETFRQLNEERAKNSKLQFQLNQLRKRLPPEWSDECSDEDILLVQDQIEIPFRQAKTSTIQLSNSSEHTNSDENKIFPSTMILQQGKLAAVKKSDTISNSPQFLRREIFTNNIDNKMKRRSFEDMGSLNVTHNSQDTMKRNSYESIPNQSYDQQNIFKEKHNSYEEINESHSLHFVNLCDDKNNRILPPAPPRRVSSLNEKTPIVKVPMQLQPKKSAVTSLTMVPSRPGASSENTNFKLLVESDYGWRFNQETSYCVEFISLLHINPLISWEDLSNLINKTFEKEFASKFFQNKGLNFKCILLYKIGDFEWRPECCPPKETVADVLQQQNNNHALDTIKIQIKGFAEKSLFSLAFSSMMCISSLEEVNRIITQENRLMFTVNDIIEGRYFVACLANWFQKTEELKNTCTILVIDEGDNLLELTKKLSNCGAIHIVNKKPVNEKFIITLNIDYIDKAGFTTLVFDWMNLVQIGNINRRIAHHSADGELCLHKDAIVLAYASNSKVISPGQWTYRLFKLISLPSLLPAFLHKWLCQNIALFSSQYISQNGMLEKIRWLTDVYQNLRKTFNKIELISKLPDVRIYLSAPLDNDEQLLIWLKDLWIAKITPCVEDSVMYRSSSATENQQNVLVAATLKALFEKAIRPGCPFNFDITTS
ncbi:uncharacterized protein LOC100200864 isoform X2 [Hydra vulgaris]|uniref:uncharacterized protein LOC100200864 isoform X2 n=1 Tax=Hydra vulgaris TaxID=6087 RepID=UPI0032EA08AE